MKRTIIKHTVYLLLIAIAAGLSPAWGAPKKKKAQKPKTETSADVKRQQETTQQEINRTREQIRLNEQEVKKKLAELSKIGDNIATGKVKVAQSAKKVETLKNEIGKLQTSIDAENRQLERLRAEYLKSVKKMRSKSKETSTLAFIFSSRNFNEAMRRMRYLRQFSKWRGNKSAEIEEHVADLKRQTQELTTAKAQHDKALAENVAAQNSLQKEYASQDAIVVELKKNGDALRSHLTKKQGEANALKNRVAALIAEEQRKAEADRQARAEAEARRKAEADRQARERAEAERKAAEAERKAAEEKRIQEERLLAQQTEADKKAQAKAKAEADKKAKAEADKQAKAKAEADKKAKAKAEADKKAKAEADKRAKAEAEKAKKDNKKKTEKEPTKESEVSYAEARGRKPRPGSTGNTNTASEPKPAPAPTAGSSFAGSKGALPRPVGGHYRITSRFGTNTLPDMPNVTYDNPGIDIETSKGATASSVFGGTVSGVYMVPGYGTVVIINHDGYYTVYGNLGQANVKVGDKVKQGSAVGHVAEDVDNPGFGMLHFEVWKNRDKQDPSAWIR